MQVEEQAVFQALARLRRQASMGQVGGFRPPDDPRSSWFGGHGVGLPGERCPQYDGREMFPLIQINVQELPCVPPQLAETALLILFLDTENLPLDQSHGVGWRIREYSSLEDLVPLPAPTKPSVVRSFPIRWTLVANDVPGWEQFWDLVDFDPTDEDFHKFPYQYKNHQGTKVGGYPSFLQGGGHVEGFVFQVDSEYKAHWEWIDRGIAYFLKPDQQEWRFSCDFLSPYVTLALHSSSVESGRCR